MAIWQWPGDGRDGRLARYNADYAETSPIECRRESRVVRTGAIPAPLGRRAWRQMERWIEKQSELSVNETKDSQSTQQQEASQEESQDVQRRLIGLQVHSVSLEQTRQLGAALGQLLAAGDVVLLSGELGAGKTVFTQGIGAGLGVAGTINSPTFTIVKEYAGRLPLYHFDLYRIEQPEEMFALGFEEYFGGEGVAVVEWAERGEDEELGAAWPERWLRVELLGSGPSTRALSVSAAGERGQELLAAFAQATRAAPLTPEQRSVEGT